MNLGTSGWDAIVVGAGVAGCAVASELMIGGLRVLLVEAGPGDPRPPSVLGLDIIAAAEETSRHWPGLQMRPSETGSIHPYRQGFGVGGGSLINALLLTPGDRRDYDRWRDQYRCLGWGAEDMAPYLDRAAARFSGRSERSSMVGHATEAFTAAAASAGHPVGGHSLEADRLGVLETRLAADGDRRVTAVEAFFGSSDRPSISVGRRVARVLIEGRAAAGVEFDDGRQERAPIVVLAAGAVGTPLLLRASSSRFSGVGRGLKDHPSFAFTIQLPAATTSAGRPLPSTGCISRILRWSSGPDEHGDLQAFVLDQVNTPAPGQPRYAVVVVGLMRVDGRGRVVGSPADGSGDPQVVTGALEDHGDRLRLRRGVLAMAELLSSRPMAPVVEAVFLDDRGTRFESMADMDDQSLDRFVADHPGPYAHPAASCPMGPDDDRLAVVSCDPETAGQVRGVDGLYAADASIFPDLVQGGLQVPVAAVATRVAAAVSAL